MKEKENKGRKRFSVGWTIDAKTKNAIDTYASEEFMTPSRALDKIVREWSQQRSKDTEMSDNLLDTQTVILERLNAIEKNVDAVRNDTDTIEDMLRIKG